jgi:hypothetical protein
MLVRTLFLFAIVAALTSCDPEHRKKCEWYLMPDQDRKIETKEGVIPVCARNFVTNKQDCRLIAPLDFAREAYNKKFKYVDMKVDGPGIPRTVLEIKFCGK